MHFHADLTYELAQATLDARHREAERHERLRQARDVRRASRGSAVTAGGSRSGRWWAAAFRRSKGEGVAPGGLASDGCASDVCAGCCAGAAPAGA